MAWAASAAARAVTFAVASAVTAEWLKPSVGTKDAYLALLEQARGDWRRGASHLAKLSVRGQAAAAIAVSSCTSAASVSGLVATVAVDLSSNWRWEVPAAGTCG